MGNIAILILAAGASRRFGAAKQLALLRSKPLLVHVLEKANSIRLDAPIWIALGANEELILKHPSVAAIKDRFHWYSVPDWEQGLGKSIQQSVRAVCEDDASLDGILVLLGDQPLIEEAQLRALLAQVSPGMPQVLCSRYNDTVGVPAFFSSHYFDDLISLEGDRGAKALIEKLDHVAFDMGNLVDVDFPADIEQIECGG